jgi:putative sterol carrier protein
MSIDAIVQELKAKFGGNASLGSRIKLDMGSDGVVLVDASASPPSISKTDGPADVTLSMSMDDLQKMLTGGLNPQMAFMSGKLKVSGDMSVAMKLAQLLG